MNYINVYKELAFMYNQDYIENFLVYYSSPVIAGIKPAVTVTINKNNNKLYYTWSKFGSQFLQSINLKYISLRENESLIIIFIYDKYLLEKQLTSTSCICFLIELGYSCTTEIDDYLDELKNRYEKCHCPHELGIFLGIPLEDVKAFMGLDNKKCMLCSYWKVYSDIDGAKAIISKLDKVKEFTINEMLEGNLSGELAMKIKNAFYEKAMF